MPRRGTNIFLLCLLMPIIVRTPSIHMKLHTSNHVKVFKSSSFSYYFKRSLSNVLAQFFSQQTSNSCMLSYSYIAGYSTQFRRYTVYSTQEASHLSIVVWLLYVFQFYISIYGQLQLAQASFCSGSFNNVQYMPHQKATNSSMA